LLRLLVVAGQVWHKWRHSGGAAYANIQSGVDISFNLPAVMVVVLAFALAVNCMKFKEVK
jgi:hypothetical protein